MPVPQVQQLYTWLGTSSLGVSLPDIDNVSKAIAFKSVNVITPIKSIGLTASILKCLMLS